MLRRLGVAGLVFALAVPGSVAAQDPTVPPGTPGAVEGTPPTQDREAWHFGGVDFPPRLDSFVVFGADRWADPAMGVVLHLGTELAPRASVDVHVRPAPGRRVHDEALRADFSEALRDLNGLSSGAVRVSVDTVYTNSVVAGGFTFPGHRAEATLRRTGESRRAWLQVLPKAPAFIRIRAIFDPPAADRLRPRLDALVVAILEQVESR